MTLSLPRRMVLAALAGGLAVLAYAPFELFPLAWIALAVLWALLAGEQRGWAGGLTGWAWGLGVFLGGVSWLYVALHRFGGMPGPLAGLAIFLFCAYLAFYPALAGWAFVRWRRGRPGPDALLAGALWLVSEWLRGTVFTGFPWLTLGYSQVPGPLAGALPLVGVYGVGGLLAGLSAWIALAWRRPLRPVLAWFGVALAGLVLGRVGWTVPAGEPVSVALLQTNIAQHQKWDPALLPHWLEHNRQMVAEHPATLTVLPETTLPLLADQLPEGYLESLAAPVRAAGGDLVVGLFLRDMAGHIYNAAASLGASPGQHYAKQHLVPFGEYSPPLFRWVYDWVNIPLSDQTRGSARQPPLALGGQKIAVNICYEDVFGEEIIRALPEATLLLNISNLAWYGDSLAQPQHLQIAQVRALESGRPMLRATNTGMTALVMPDGRVAEVLPAFQRGALVTQVQGYAGLTPYARFGNLPVLLLGGVFLIRAWRGRRTFGGPARSQGA